MNITAVKILSWDAQSGYKVSYCVESATGIIRKSVAYYSNGTLSRDSSPELVNMVEEAVSRAEALGMIH